MAHPDHSASYKRYLEPGSLEPIPSSSYYRAKKRKQKTSDYLRSPGPSNAELVEASRGKIDYLRSPGPSDAESVEASGGWAPDDKVFEAGSSVSDDTAINVDKMILRESFNSPEIPFQPGVMQLLSECVDELDGKPTNKAEEVHEEVPDFLMDEFNDDRSFTDAINCGEPGDNLGIEDRVPMASYHSLEDAISHGAFQETVDMPVDKTIGELVLILIKFALVHALSLTATTDLFELINCMFAEPILCGTRHLIDKLFYPRGCTELYAICTECGASIGRFSRTDRLLKCHICNATINVTDNTYKDFFVMMDIESPISKLIESNSHYYLGIVNRGISPNSMLSDIYDGNKYQEFVGLLNDKDRHQYATLTFNTDGAPLFESSNYSIWPIFLMLNELPYHVRSKELILAGLWFGKDKPNMNVFLDPFVTNMNKLSTNGVKCTISGHEKQIKCFALVCCVDAVARAPVQGFTQFNGAYGCGQCLHPGEWVSNNSANRRTGTMKFTLQDDVPRRRDCYETVQHMQQAALSNKPVFGVKCASPLINLIHYNIIDGCVVDSLHCVSGIAKQFASLWFGNRQRTGLLPRSVVTQIDARLTVIKSPHQVARLTRPLSEKEFWKAREWENWTIFYSMVVLKDILPNRWLMHWALFVEALYTLNKAQLAMREIDTSDRLLHEFVGYVQILYGKAAMTFNVHSLLHLSKSVSDWGPLWCHNAYAFESGNGDLLKIVHAAKGVHHQICRRISLKYSFISLKDHVFSYSSCLVQQYCNSIGNTIARHTLHINGIRYFGTVAKIPDLWVTRLGLSDSSVSYNKIVKDGCLYMSSRRNNNRSDNSYVFLKNGLYAKIDSFIVDWERQKEYTIVSLVDTSTAFDEVCSMLRIIVDKNTEKSAILSTDIDKVCVHITCNGNFYLSTVPNLNYY